MADIFDPLEPSPYKVLNVAQDATTQQIRTAHRKLVLVFHPDKVQNESEKAAKTERFQEIQHAYEILQDEKRRSRWDKRAADRDRQMEERRMPRKASAYTPSRPAQAPVFENRDGVIYEERVPRYARQFEENMFDAAFATGSSKPSKKWDDTYEESSSRRSSGRGPETRSRYKDMDSELYAKAQEKKKKEETRKAREEAEKRRDKAKRQEKEASFTRRTRVDDYDGSDDYDDRHYSSKSDSKSKSKTTESKRYKDDPPRRSSKKDTRDGDSDLDRKIYTVHDYIGKSRDTEPDKKRPSRGRADSFSSRTQLPTPPPTPRDRDSGRRSSGDDGRKSSARSRRPPSPVRRHTYRNIDIVEPPSATNSRNVSGTADRTLPREKTMPSRSRTAYVEPNLPKPGGLKRAETMPIHQMKSASNPRKATKARQDLFDVTDSSDDSVSSSESDSDTEVRTSKPMSSAKRPPLQPTPVRYSSYKVTMDDDRSQVVTAEPESYDDRSRDNSPKTNPRRSTTTDRYAHANTRSPLAHSSTFQGRPTPRNTDPSSTRNMPSLRTTQSARGDHHPHLFGALDNDQHSPRTTSSPKGFPDIRSGRDTNSHSRRGSEDVQADYSPRSRRMDHRRGHSSREIPAR